MLLRMIRGVLFHQKGKMLLIAFTIALGASLATGMLNVMMDVGDKVNQELKNYGANIVVKPKDSSLLSDIYDVGEGGEELNTAWLKEEDLGKIKTIFWAFNIVDFAPGYPGGAAGRGSGEAERQLVQPPSVPAHGRGAGCRHGRHALLVGCDGRPVAGREG